MWKECPHCVAGGAAVINDGAMKRRLMSGKVSRHMSGNRMVYVYKDCRRAYASRCWRCGMSHWQLDGVVGHITAKMMPMYASKSAPRPPPPSPTRGQSTWTPKCDQHSYPSSQSTSKRLSNNPLLQPLRPSPLPFRISLAPHRLLRLLSLVSAALLDRPNLALQLSLTRHSPTHP